MKKQFYLIDTSALLSGVNLNFQNKVLVTTPNIAQELRSGGRDYRNFQYLREKGLLLMEATADSTRKVSIIARSLGEISRLSKADLSLVALAYELSQQQSKDIYILTDDYSIQNLATYLYIPFISILKKGITKKFKWGSRCPGCKTQFKKPVKICPICGMQTHFSSRENVNKKP